MSLVESTPFSLGVGEIAESSMPKPPRSPSELPYLNPTVRKATIRTPNTHSAHHKPLNRSLNSLEYANGKCSQESIVILVLGTRGSGKSNFISSVSGIKVDQVSGTKDCLPWKFPYGERQVTLLDTKGFDDTIQADLCTLESIVGHVNVLGPLSGVIYLHRITDKRMTGSAHRNVKILRELCGQEFCPRVVFATSMWNHIDEQDSCVYSREKELQGKFWKDMMERGAQYCRFDGTQHSGKSITELLVSDPKQVCLAVEREIDSMRLEDTGAGRVITSEARLREERCQREEKEEDNPLEIKNERVMGHDEGLMLKMLHGSNPFHFIVSRVKNLVEKLWTN